MKMETSAKLYSLNYSNVKTYLFALLFVAGNIALHPTVPPRSLRWTDFITNLLFYLNCRL